MEPRFQSRLGLHYDLILGSFKYLVRLSGRMPYLICWRGKLNPMPLYTAASKLSLIKEAKHKNKLNGVKDSEMWKVSSKMHSKW